MTGVKEARQRLDKTLASVALSDPAILSNLVRKQLLKTNPEKSATDEVVEKRSKQLLKLLDALKSAKGERSTKVVDGEWKVKQDTPRFRVMYREGPEGAPYHSLCLEGIIDGPMSHAVVVGWEVPMYREWWPQFTAPTFKIIEARYLERNTVGGDHSVLRFKVPWPFAMREVILSAYELEYFDEDLIAVLYKSTPDVPDEKVDGINSNQIPESLSNAVRMDLEGGFVLQKIAHDCNFFRIVADLDMKLDFVPPWLINFIARQLVGHGYKLYQKAVAGVKGSLLEKLVNTDPMYRRIQVLDNMPLNVYEHPLMPMLSSEKDVAGFYDGPYKQGIDPYDMKHGFCQIPENIVEAEKRNTPEGEKQNTLLDNNINTTDALSSSDTSNARREVGLNDSTSTVSPTPEHPRAVREEDRAVDPEVAWALGVLEKLIAHFTSQRASSPTSESRGISSVHNDISVYSELVCSTAKLESFHEVEEYLDTLEEFHSQNPPTNHDMCETKTSQSSAAHAKVIEVPEPGAETPIPLHEGKLHQVKRVGSSKSTALPNGKETIQPSRTHHRGLGFFKFGRRHKESRK
ncbi:uncharacterized protein [Physcomitrium patens]|uniref:START domain-containing protein n=2 Tax=Physcomitrium patens TaxID=3218 RepID=A0A2K1K4F7_PHYPA|nr:uncharacterized protein LOC112286620 [Physcomitrium patens]PNR48650.1 hypothetical protein PHYPA_013127 [Physcomitrium patens]|eukprot:XP_024384441.1 uncharacterized protein LOC112286620 [Physcomitrella patens]